MIISKVIITNYKSFLVSPEIEFFPGFNIIVGQNNVGKTALIEALSLAFDNLPHRSLYTAPDASTALEPTSKIDIEFELNGQEMSTILQSIPSFNVPSVHQPFHDITLTDAKGTLASVLEKCVIRYEFHNGDFRSCQIIEPSLRGYYTDEYHANVEFKFETEKGTFVHTEQMSSYDLHKAFFMQCKKNLRMRIYSFRAERMNIGEADVNRQQLLLPDASNLAQVLHDLISRDTGLFYHYVQLVRQVFPEIRHVTIPLISSQRTQVLLWTITPDSKRPDLAIPLSQSGTGIGQVLAILYVISTSNYPQVILIDEPQSFLHPGAIRKLFDILKQHPHQYIITTHSPIAITTADPNNIILVRKEDSKSVINRIDTRENHQINMYLSEIGARLSDVFGADNILWVEGRTEEECLPLITNQLLQQPLLGTEIIGVMHTGDFDGKDPAKVIHIYQRLSQGRGLLPPAIAFIFDREGRTPEQMDDLKRLCKDKETGRDYIFFTQRRMYENYLLDAEAIAHVMSNIEGFRDSPVESAEVETWLQSDHWDNRTYFEQVISESDRNPETWHNEVHGGNVLNDMFNEFSEARVSYKANKVTYGVHLTQWLIDNKPDKLSDIRTLLESALQRDIHIDEKLF